MTTAAFTSTTRHLVRSALAALILAPTAALAAQSAAAFVDVTVLPMDADRAIAGQTVLVEGGVITAMGPAGTVNVPEGATRIDGAGRYLMPGFAEMHAHVPGGNDPALVENVLFLWVANGVTTIRGMQGNPSHLELRDRIAAGDVLGPTFVAAGPALSGNSIQTVDAARSAVEAQHAAGYDLLKVHEGIRPDVYAAMAETAHRVGIPFGGHVPNDVGLYAALEAGQASIDHMDNVIDALIPADAPVRDAAGLTQAGAVVMHADPTMIPAVAARVRGAGAWVVPTVALWETFNDQRTADEVEAALPETRYVPDGMVQGWRNAKERMRGGDAEAGRRTIELRRQILKGFADAGVPLIFGTDAPQIFSVPGFSIHREIDVMTAAGLSPWQILESGTRNVAAYLGQADAFGTVAVGMRADLILLEANPLEDPANLQRRAGVMVRGTWLPESEIQARLAEIAEAYGG